MTLKLFSVKVESIASSNNVIKVCRHWWIVEGVVPTEQQTDMAWAIIWC